MARPQKNNADYFSHDNDMRNDEKIKAVRRRFKHEGYSIWNMMLEKLCKSDGFTLDYSEINFELWAGDFEIDTDYLKEIIEYFIKVELLSVHDNFIFSETLIDRFNGLIAKRNKQKEWLSTSKTKANKVIDIDNTHSKVKYSKVNKSIVKESKVKKSIEDHLFTKSPFFDFDAFQKEFSGTDYEFCDLKIYYEKIKNWSEGGGKKKKNWIATARNFMLSDKQDGKLILKQGTYVNGDNKKQSEFGAEVNETIERRYNNRPA